MKIVLFLLLFLVVLLILPVRYSLSGNWREQLSLHIRVSYGFLWGALVKEADTTSFNIGSLHWTFFSPKFQERGEKKNKTKKSAAKKTRARIIRLLNRNFIKRVLMTLQKCLKACWPDKFEIAGVIGFKDPYYTGILAAFLAVFHVDGLFLDFTEEIYDLELNVRGSIVPIVLVYYVVTLLLSAEVWRVFNPLRKWRQKEVV